MTPSPNTVHLSAGGGGVRVKSYTPLIVPGHKSQYHHHNQHHHNDQRMRTTSGSSSSSSSVEKSSQEFYAGAKFDFSPSVASLPTPPTNWTIPLIRSQSQPSSPVTTSMTNNHQQQQQQNGSSIITKKIDVNSLFLTPQSNKVVKASSFEMVKGSTNTVNNEKMFEREQRLGTQRKMNKKTVDKFSQSRNRNWNEKDTLKSNQKSAIVTSTTTIISNNNNTKNTSNTTTIPTNKMNTPKNHHQQQQTYHHSSTTTTTSSSPRSVIQVVETKQKQMMYPQLTEHLRGLLKVQG